MSDILLSFSIRIPSQLFGCILFLLLYLQISPRYAISVARKIGCLVFLLWEDIVEVRQAH